MNGDMSGTCDGAPWPGRGEIVEVDEVTAAKLLGNGMASPVRHKKYDEVEAAVVSEDDVETATVNTEPKRSTKKT
jgi:hypothetical protein